MSPKGGRRVGAGRPKTLEYPVKAAFWLDRGVFEKAKAAARAKGTTVSEVVRSAVERLAGGRRHVPFVSAIISSTLMTCAVDTASMTRLARLTSIHNWIVEDLSSRAGAGASSGRRRVERNG